VNRWPRHLHVASLVAGDLALTGLALFLADRGRHHLPIGDPITVDTVYLTPLVWSLVATIWLTVFHLWGAYEWRHLGDAGEERKTVFFAITFSFFTFASSIYFLKILDFSRLLSFYFYLLDLGLILGFRALMRWIFSRLKVPGYGTKRILIVGAGEAGMDLAERLARGQEYQVMGFLEDTGEGESAHSPVPVLGGLVEAGQVVNRHGIDEVIISPTAKGREELADLILALRDQAVKIRMVPDILEMVTIRTGIENLRGIPLISLREPAVVGLNRVMKRGLDLVGSSVGLVVLGPFMVFIALLIKLDSPGPVLFVQERVGQYGRTFRMYKFRTMVRNAEELLEQLIDLEKLEQPVFKLKDDPRVTRVGRWLRRTSLDELPQLLNVLKGEMSLVGPRPEEVRIVQKYDPWQSQRLLVKPGMTGSMQVSGRADLPLDKRVKLELAYIENYSILEDIKILVKTLPAVLSGKGSY
jgi:exopolysaccharide biosynthesis polyprenyl glycosylphosphotransferase